MDEEHWTLVLFQDREDSRFKILFPATGFRHSQSHHWMKRYWARRILHPLNYSVILTTRPTTVRRPDARPGPQPAAAFSSNGNPVVNGEPNQKKPRGATRHVKRSRRQYSAIMPPNLS